MFSKHRMKTASVKHQLFIIAGAILLFFPFLGAVHLFDWDEVNFAECAREMVVTGDYFNVQINFQPFWEKPPVFIWMQAVSMNIFGVNEFAARLPNALCGIATLLVLFNIGRRLVGVNFGWWWVLVYVGSFLPHLYFKSGIIDPWFNLFIFLGIYFFVRLTDAETPASKSSRYRNLAASALFISLAMLTKGPVAVLIFGLCVAVFWVMVKFRNFIRFGEILFYGLVVLLVGGLWFGILLLTGHPEVITAFFEYQVRLLQTQDAGHGGPFYYHWIVLLVGCFPLSVFALGGFGRISNQTDSVRHFTRWMKVLFWVVLLLFSLVKTKILHYSSLCYFPLSFLGALTVYRLVNGEIAWKRIYTFLLLVISSIIGVTLAALPLVDVFKQDIISSGIIHDPFAVENLKAEVQWHGYESLPGLLLVVGIGIILLAGGWRGRQPRTLSLLGVPANQSVGIKKTITSIFITCMVAINLAMLAVVPRIEPYSQGAAIEFYKTLVNKDCYMETIGFKSYAHLFYAQKEKTTNPQSLNKDWLLTGDIDKPAYFVCKITKADEAKAAYPQLTELYRKNGFVFWKREK